MATETLTIGQLARRVGVRPSALRYYESEGLISPIGRTESGYRRYAPETEQVLHFIQRAQRLGFSLSDIHTLLQAGQSGLPNEEAVLAVAEARYLAMERQITTLLIQRHELEHFLRDLGHTAVEGGKSASIVERLLDRVCPAPLDPPSVQAALEWLVEHTHCNLTTLEDRSLMARLRGRHVHIWQEDDSYRILIVGHDPAVEVALRDLAELEAACHAHPAPQLAVSDEGYLFTVSGENAFVFARLFLALEQGLQDIV